MSRDIALLKAAGIKCPGNDLEKDLGITIIEHGIKNQDRRKRIEDKYICKLQTFTGSGINKSMRAYGREMYTTWKLI